MFFSPRIHPSICNSLKRLQDSRTSPSNLPWLHYIQQVLGILQLGRAHLTPVVKATCALPQTLSTYLQDTYCIDSWGIYANGMSNGGEFVNILACSPNGSDFAAFAPVSNVDRLALLFPSLKYMAWSTWSYHTIESRLGALGYHHSSTPNTTRNLVGGHVQRISYYCKGKSEIVIGLVNEMDRS